MKSFRMARHGARSSRGNWRNLWLLSFLIGAGFGRSSSSSNGLRRDAASGGDQRSHRRRALLEGETDPADWEKESIPQMMWFTYKYNIILERQPRHMFENVMDTILRYREAWDDPAATVHFLDDFRCRKEVEAMDPRMVKFFDEEREGRFRSDICRVAALYTSGGYYFDVDIQVVDAYEPSPETSMATVMSGTETADEFFQAFIAVKKNHPFMRAAMDEMYEFYSAGKLYHDDDKDKLRRILVGPHTMNLAYIKAEDSVKKNMHIMFEVNLENNPTNPELPRLPGVPLCNWAVHDYESQMVYFFSRFCCLLSNGHTAKVEDHLSDQCESIRKVSYGDQG